ncbi:MAG TPA: hypothetical protein VGP73_20320 [Thermoanaerobaculia bacterium]
MRQFRKLAAILFLFVLLVPLAASAASSKAGLSHKPAKAELIPVSLGSRVWAMVFGIWQKAGCDIDPSGRCAPSSAPLNSLDAGCEIDPHGRCLS